MIILYCIIVHNMIVDEFRPLNSYVEDVSGSVQVEGNAGYCFERERVGVAQKLELPLQSVVFRATCLTDMNMCARGTELKSTSSHACILAFPYSFFCILNSGTRNNESLLSH